jgi:methyl-accepting chemotaxis protein
VAELERSAAGIGALVATIAEIASRTNLLALNPNFAAENG